jgi:hypothetical protein
VASEERSNFHFLSDIRNEFFPLNPRGIIRHFAELLLSSHTITADDDKFNATKKKQKFAHFYNLSHYGEMSKSKVLLSAVAIRVSYSVFSEFCEKKTRRSFMFP